MKYILFLPAALCFVSCSYSPGQGWRPASFETKGFHGAFASNDLAVISDEI